MTTAALSGDPHVVVSSSTLQGFRAVLVDERRPRPVWLLGAGASVTSGVPQVVRLIDMIARFGYCLENAMATDDPRPQRSEWTRWLAGKDWYEPDAPLEVRYPILVERLLQPKQHRKDFFTRALREGVVASEGYVHLAELVSKGWVRTVLTTNFDDLAYQSCRSQPGTSAFIEAVKSPIEMNLVSTDPASPQVIHLHGTVEHYSDCNLQDETQALDARVKSAAAPLLRDHPVIVMGYRGAEPSIMSDLFLDGADSPGHYPHGIYWCRRDSEDLHPLVLRLAERIGHNFQLIPIDGFDEAMAFLANGAPHSARAKPPSAGSAPDLRTASVGLDRLDWTTVSRLLPGAARALDVSVPPAPDRRWVEDTLVTLNLARQDGPHIKPTRAGELLFSVDSPVLVHIRWGVTTKELAGNITGMLESAGSVLAEANKPFRLIGPQSSDVRPYPPLAIKELLVNALVHRDYDQAEPVTITGNTEQLEFRSPGDVVEGVDVTGLGRDSKTGYRNPVIASFLVGTGAMDQRGSGLVNVREWTERDGGGADFGVAATAGDACFVARLRSRPERPGVITGVAEPPKGYEVFFANALPVRFLRGVIDVAASPVTDRSRVFDRHHGEQTAPFVPHGGTLISLSDLSAVGNPLSKEISGDVAHIPIGDFCESPDDERRLVELLNESFRRHAKACGMLSLGRGQRVYFPKSEDGERRITYHGRLRDATRTVVKVRKKADGTVSYYEHEATHWRFRQFGGEWYLLLVPGWVFTRDGEEALIDAKRTTSLSTKRAARDYNANVAAHVWFWAAALAGDDRGTVMEDGAGTIILDHNPVTTQVVGVPSAPGDDDTVADAIRVEDLDELGAELDELADHQTEGESDEEEEA